MIPQQARVFVLPNLLQITSTLTNVHTNGWMGCLEMDFCGKMSTD